MQSKNKTEKKLFGFLTVALLLLGFFVCENTRTAEAATETPSAAPALTEEQQPIAFSYVDLNKALSFELKNQDFASFLDRNFDIQSFMSKPVRLPLASDNPDGVPGGDQDFLYIYPPEFFFSEKTGQISTLPSKIMYFGSGQKINDNRARYFRSDLQKKVVELLENKKDQVESLRAVIVKQSAKRYRQIGLMTDYSQKLGCNQSNEQESLLEKIFSLKKAQAEETNATELTNLVSDLQNQISDQATGATDYSQDDAIEKIIGSGDSQTREMLSLLLLLLIYKNALAEPQTDLKTQCVEAGGEWVNETCSVDVNSSAGSNVTALGTKKICEESGGTWKTEYPMRKVCMAMCGAKDDECTDRILANEIANKGCVCPDGSCVTAVGDCLAQDASKTDKDEDEIPDGVDKCPKSKDVESGVNMNDQSENYGCTCADLQAKGKIQQRQCPGSACDGSYMVTYAQSSGTDTCEMGNIIAFSCVANRTADQNCQKAAESDKKDDEKKEDNMDWMKMLQQLMQGGGGGQGGGSGGGSGGGGGGGGGGNPNTGGDPTTSPGPTKPTIPSTTQTTGQTKPPISTSGPIKSPDGSTSVYTTEPNTGRITKTTYDPNTGKVQTTEIADPSSLPSPKPLGQAFADKNAANLGKAFADQKAPTGVLGKNPPSLDQTSPGSTGSPGSESPSAAQQAYTAKQAELAQAQQRLGEVENAQKLVDDYQNKSWGEAFRDWAFQTSDRQAYTKAKEILEENYSNNARSNVEKLQSELDSMNPEPLKNFLSSSSDTSVVAGQTTSAEASSSRPPMTPSERTSLSQRVFGDPDTADNLNISDRDLGNLEGTKNMIRGKLAERFEEVDPSSFRTMYGDTVIKGMNLDQETLSKIDNYAKKMTDDVLNNGKILEDYEKEFLKANAEEKMMQQDIQDIKEGFDQNNPRPWDTYSPENTGSGANNQTSPDFETERAALEKAQENMRTFPGTDWSDIEVPNSPLGGETPVTKDFETERAALEKAQEYMRTFPGTDWSGIEVPNSPLGGETPETKLWGQGSEGKFQDWWDRGGGGKQDFSKDPSGNPINTSGVNPDAPTSLDGLMGAPSTPTGGWSTPAGAGSTGPSVGDPKLDWLDSLMGLPAESVVGPLKGEQAERQTNQKGQKPAKEGGPQGQGEETDQTKDK